MVRDNQKKGKILLQPMKMFAYLHPYLDINFADIHYPVKIFRGSTE